MAQGHPEQQEVSLGLVAPEVFFPVILFNCLLKVSKTFIVDIPSILKNSGNLFCIWKNTSCAQ